jgi:glycine dehydrogenase subunit 2
MRYRQASYSEPLLFELPASERQAAFFNPEIAELPQIPKKLKREKLELPRLSEPEVVRHFVRLSQMNFGVESGLYPLGSCTMKYNPRVCEELASKPQVTLIHPLQDPSTIQGALEILYRLERMLAEIAGVPYVCLQPAAGAHGELLGMLLTRAYFKDLGEERTEVIIPDSAHGTNFASAAMAGFRVVIVPSNSRGRVDLPALRSAVSERTAALMLTNPNTLGLFEDEIREIASMLHDVGALLYYDGANLNGILGKTRPGDMGFDIVHFNLHKTFSTPHGGGGPGAGPVGVSEKLEPYLPVPIIRYDEKNDRYWLDYNRPKTIGKIRSFFGNFGVLVKAYAYLLMMGADGLKEATEIAVLNANYLKDKLKHVPGFEVRHDPDAPCKHEFVLSAEPLKRETGVTARDVAKRLLDFGFHAPTYYFPPIVPEALMIEPTETEPKEELDRFVDALKRIAEEARKDPEKVRGAPFSTAVSRVDEVRASRQPILSWKQSVRTSTIKNS